MRNVKKSDNITSAIHALIVIIISGAYFMRNIEVLHEMIRITSTGYFLYDLTFILLRQSGFSLVDASYIYHHIATIYFINFFPNFYRQVEVMFLAELSNIPTYFVYHYLHSKNCKPELKLWKFIQKIVYIQIRYVLLTLLFYLEYTSSKITLSHIVVAPVYLLGLIWGYKIIST